MTGYTMVDHVMLNAFVERWNHETLSFHLPRDEISITLDNVSCLLHLLIMRRFLDHGRNIKDEAVEMMIDYMRDDPEKTVEEVDRIRGAHSRFEFLRNIHVIEI